MHPIEHLRYVARASGLPADVAVAETADALRSFASDPVALVTAARRVVSRQPSCGPLWNLCAAMLCSADPRAAATGFVSVMEEDETPTHLAAAIGDDALVTVSGWPVVTSRVLAGRPDVTVLISDVAGDGSALARELSRRDHDAVDLPSHGVAGAVASSDMVVVEAFASGGGSALVSAGSVAMAAVAAQRGIPVLLVAPMGTSLSPSTWTALLGRRGESDEQWEDLDEILALSLVGTVVGPGGLGAPSVLDRREDGPVAVELHRPDVT